MDWQQGSSLVIVIITAVLLVRHYYRRRGRLSDCDGCSCSTMKQVKDGSNGVPEA